MPRFLYFAGLNQAGEAIQYSVFLYTGVIFVMFWRAITLATSQVSAGGEGKKQVYFLQALFSVFRTFNEKKTAYEKFENGLETHSPKHYIIYP